MAVTANQLVKVNGSTRTARRKAVASVAHYQGTFCFLVAASGYATSSTATGANRFGGIVKDYTDNSSGASGDLEFEAYVDGIFTLVNVTSSLALADVGKVIYASDNHTVTTTSTNNVIIGILQDVDANGDPVIQLTTP